MSRPFFPFPLRLTLCLLVAVTSSSFAQEPPAAHTAVSCNSESALATLEEQIDSSRTFPDAVQRVAVLIRAGDLLWSYQQERARALFGEAFELAVRNYQENGDEPRHDGHFLMMSIPDQRFVVTNALAKRDPVWAQKLLNESLSDRRRSAGASAFKDLQAQTRIAQKLLGIASSLAASNLPAALNFARSSLRYPATLHLSELLYQVAGINRPLADEFYLEALSAYAQAPADRLLYLSSFPFGNDREAGEMPGYTTYHVPGNFVRSASLQRSFVQVLLGRIQLGPGQTTGPATVTRFSEVEQMWLALTRLEKQIQLTLPDLAVPVEQAKGNLLGLLRPGSQTRLGDIVSERDAPLKTFDEQVEAAEKIPVVDRRDQGLAYAVTSASATEDLNRLLGVADRISDAAVRAQLLNWLYFTRTQSALKDKQLSEARRLAAKVAELDQRAYLYFQIADESLKQSMDQTQVREMLAEVVDSAERAPATLVTARTQLGVAYLYSKIDLNRANAVLGNAVTTINRLEHPDFSRQSVLRKIEGKTFGSYASFQTPGFTAENTFRELGKADLEGALSQARRLTDRFLRARTIVSVMEPCLRQAAESEEKPNR